MKKVPSALKWLAEKRARVTGELQCAVQVSERLREDVAEARESLHLAERLREAAAQKDARSVAYFSPSWTAFQADGGRDFNVIVDGVSV